MERIDVEAPVPGQDHTHVLTLLRDIEHGECDAWECGASWADWSCWVALAHAIIEEDIRRRIGG
jgi:hypothetical protein